jgi:hypothetical protein
MTPEDAQRYEELLLAIIMVELVLFVLFVVAIKVWQSMTVSPEVIEYLRTCNDTCELLT